MLFWTRKSYAKRWLYYNFSTLNATRGWNENDSYDRFSARLGLAKLMPGREIKNVVFHGNTRILKEGKHMAFLPLPRPTYIQK